MAIRSEFSTKFVHFFAQRVLKYFPLYVHARRVLSVYCFLSMPGACSWSVCTISPAYAGRVLSLLFPLHAR